MSFLRTWLTRIGILGLVLTCMLLLVLAADRLLLPAWTRLGHEEKTPQLIGLDIDAAIERADEQGFEIVVERRRGDPTGRYKLNQVMEQFPQPGRLSKKGRRIYLSVCAGGEHVVIPDLTGLSFRQAAGRLADIDLRVDSTRISYRHDDRLGRDAIVEQHPAAGDSLLPGGSLSFVLSLGVLPEQVMVPELIGLDRTQVRHVLERSGLRLGRVTLLLESGHGPGLRRQSPAAGHMTEPGAEVDVWINLEEPE